MFVGVGIAIALNGCGSSAAPPPQTSTTTTPSNALDVLTWQRDLLRTGQNLNETVLTPANVNATTFGKRFAFAVDGYVYAQPLIVMGQSIASGTHNVVYVATAHDSVYAFDADGATTTAYWQTSFVDTTKGVVPVPGADVGVGDEWGIIGTPVIDRSRNAIYMVSRVKNTNDGTYHQYIHALDLSTGQEKNGGPVEIKACVAGTGDAASNGQVCFDAKQEQNRVSLALVNGVVYAGWASLADVTPYHGWILGYNADTLAQAAVFNSTPNGGDGGYWMSGAAPGVDSAGNIFFVAGNGDFDASEGNYGQSVVRFSYANNQLNVNDYFTPFNWAALEPSDLDVGSGGLLLLPDNASTHPHEAVVAGKEGRLYLLDRDNLGKFHSGSDQIVQTITSAFPGGLFSTGAYWNGNVYFVGNADVIKQFAWTNGTLSATPTAVGTTQYSFPGATPSVSSNGTTNGIVWTLERATGNHAVLRAYDASNVAHELYNSDTNSTRDNAGSSTKFTVPTVTNGKVYIGTVYQVEVYGLQ